MNVKFQTVINDLTGASGLKVIQSILDGHRDPAHLLTLCDPQIHKHKGDRVKESLRGIWREEHLFALRQALEGWQFYQHQIADCDHAIEHVLRELGGPPRNASSDSPAKPGGPHTPKIDGLHRMLLQLCGDCDPTRLPGMADYSL